jgi:hypothetical protein
MNRFSMTASHENARASFHDRFDVEMVFHPSIEEKGMTTMRLHRLHFSSKLWSRTFAMSWPHSQRVSEASDVLRGEAPVIIKSLLALP